ncbi:MAG TPA: hypothetical protein VFC41_09285 [Anaerovoracaceae bacterium]|nr:hypothetical protein [Anaerovoracaceae bacterium]
MNDQQKSAPKRPFFFKMLVLSLLIISLAGWMRLIQSIYQWQNLVAYNIKPGPLYTTISGLIIGLIASTSAVVLWLRLSRAKIIVQITVVTLISGWWLDYLLFTHSSTAFANLPFHIAVTVIYLVFVFIYLQYAPAIKRIRKPK